MATTKPTRIGKGWLQPTYPGGDAAFMLLELNAANGRSRAAPSRKPDSGHTGTISSTVWVRQAS